MTLPAEIIKEFQVLYLQQYHSRLSNGEAEEKALNLLRLFRIIYRPFRELGENLRKAKTV